MTQLPAGIRFIERGWLHSNHVVITDSNGPVIVDTGQHTGVEQTVALLRKQGVEPSNLQKIITTHCHTDHWGANAYLHKLSGAPVACGPLTAQILTHYDTQAMWIDYFGIERFEPPPPSPVSQILLPGEELTIGSYLFEVYEAPGHAPDSIALFERQHRILLCADTMFRNDCGVMNLKVSGPETISHAIETLTQLQALNAAVALPGHGPIITQVNRNIKTVITILRKLQQYPKKHARHLAARSFVYSLLLLQPIPYLELVSLLKDTPWIKDTAETLQLESTTNLLENLIQELLQRGTVQQNNGVLTSSVSL